jgi:outer membrane autotransporter protein
MQTSTDKVEGSGWMIGPYGTLKLSNNLYLQGRAAWGRSSDSISPLGTYEHSFDSERWLLRGGLQGQWQYGAVIVRPGLSVSYIHDRTEAYVDTPGTLIPSISASLGQARFGSEIAYRMALPNGSSVEPRVKFEGLWNFAENVHAGTIGDLVVGTDDLRGRLELGLRMQASPATMGMMLDRAASYDGIGVSGYKALEGKAAVRVPLN